MPHKAPPLPNRVAEMLKLADAVAVWCPPTRVYRRSHDMPEEKSGFFVVQMRPDLPQRGAVAVESHGGWTYQAFADAVKELLES